MRIIHLSTRSVTYSDPKMRYVSRLHDRYLEDNKVNYTAAFFFFYIHYKYQRYRL